MEWVTPAAPKRNGADPAPATVNSVDARVQSLLV